MKGVTKSSTARRAQVNGLRDGSLFVKQAEVGQLRGIAAEMPAANQSKSTRNSNLGKATQPPMTTVAGSADQPTEKHGKMRRTKLQGTTESVPWPADPRERCDFYHRARTFPRDVAAWRKRLVSRIVSGEAELPGVRGSTSEHVRDLVDDGISYLREIARILALLHGSPRLGNPEDPVDELVYIILARKTREGAYQRTFKLLKDRFRTWDDLLKASTKDVQRLIHGGGLSRKKTSSVFAALTRLKDEFGCCTLAPARSWSDSKVEAFLCALPEISRKSAYCIMMYSLNRSVFPVDTHVGRVLTRLGPFRELGLSLHGLDHKQLQASLADLIPPNLRYSLHVNLLTHGRAVCKGQRPLCDQCELRSFCSSYRKEAAARAAAAGGPTVVDLFAGAGGLSEGFTRAGFRIVAAVEHDQAAAKTYWLNHPSVPDKGLVTEDIRKLGPGDLRRLAKVRSVDVLIGAPPCQGFSHAGFRSKSTKTGYRIGDDERNFLFESMIAAAHELRPKLFLMENVPGMHSARKDNLSYLELAARRLEEDRMYRSTIWRLNAAAFGVPQDRVRYFLVATRTDTLPVQPGEDYQDLRGKRFDVDALPPVTLEEATFDLPPRLSGQGTATDLWNGAVAMPSTDPRYRRYLAKFGLRRPSNLIYNHTVRSHNNRDLELYALLRPGEDSIHAVERYGRPDLMRYRRDVFDDKYGRLRADRPSKTIVSHLAKDGNGYIHPSQVRSISVREAARLQSFHDGYAFCGSVSDQWTQVGNAVPPVLGEQIAKSFLRALGRGVGQ